MTVLAELTADFPWGVLVVTDDSSVEEIPQWSRPDQVVAVAKSALAVRVRHADEGPVTIRVCDTQIDAVGELVFAGSLHLESGVLRICDALCEESAVVQIAAAGLNVGVYANQRSEATAIDVVIGRVSGS